MWNVATGCILIQQFPEGKRISAFNSLVFDKAEQKCPLFTENYAESYQTSRHTNITLSGHHFPSIFIVIINQFLIYGDANDNYHIVFFRSQVIITKFQNLRIIWTPGSISAFPDILSRNITIEEYQMHQLQHKRIPRDIEFFDE